ncbi:PH domain-containing protein [Actinomadura sp. ATCC 31491]|uniref:PH domain-containing protein n=1 Tax=Actinomadura luzonensis TaxID=2805427 RepID=A0ABT0G046_9ACTN|nr:PH domain-containing protein [Actinomadura luzonensis]MCK2217575.1 PH domain-containing protein [Actinomadura luzonensis]
MTDPRPHHPAAGPPDPAAPPGPMPGPMPGPPPGPLPPPQGPYGRPPAPYGPGVLPVPLRLSPKVLLIDPVRMLPSLLLPLVGVLFAGGFSPRSYAWAAFGVVGTVLFAVIRWATFTYQIAGDRLETKRAFISRSVRTIPLERIRGVDVSTPPMHRLLGLAVLKIDTGASGGKEEAELDGVTLTEAERLKAVLLRRAATPARAAAGPVPHAAVERPIARVPKRWLLYGPLSGAYLLTPFALAGGAVGLAFQWGDELGFGQDAAWHAGQWLWERPYLLLIAAVLLVLAMPVLGGVMYVIFNWDFVLKRRDGYLVAERGLVNRRSVSLESQRVRGYELVDGLAERWAGVVRAWAIVTGLGDSRTRGQLLPDVPRPFALAVTGEAVGPYDAVLRSHPPVARNRRLFRAVFPWAVVTLLSGVAAVTTGMMLWWVLFVVALLLACAGVPLGLDRYASLGHGYDGVRLSVRSGSLRRAQAVVERRAVVGWRLRQTWFQRRAGVLTLIAGVGAGTGGYEAIDVSEAEGVAFPAEVTPEWLIPFLGAPASPEES